MPSHHTEAELPLILKTVSFLLSADPKIMLAAAAGSSLAPAIPPCSAGCSGICAVAGSMEWERWKRRLMSLSMHKCPDPGARMSYNSLMCQYLKADMDLSCPPKDKKQTTNQNVQICKLKLSSKELSHPWSIERMKISLLPSPPHVAPVCAAFRSNSAPAH